LPEYVFFPHFLEAHIRPARYIKLFKVVLDSLACRNSLAMFLLYQTKVEVTGSNNASILHHYKNIYVCHNIYSTSCLRGKSEVFIKFLCYFYEPKTSFL
jgi:hypothetical protein